MILIVFSQCTFIYKLNKCQQGYSHATGSWPNRDPGAGRPTRANRLPGSANEYSSHLLVHHQLGKDDVPLEEDRIAKFMIDRLVH